MDWLTQIDYEKFSKDFLDNMQVFLPLLTAIAAIFVAYWVIKGLVKAIAVFTRAVKRSIRVQAIIRCARANRQIVGEGPKMHPKRESHARRVIESKLTDLLEDAEFQGELTREEKEYWYRRFANCFNMPSLLARKTVEQKPLKEELKANYFKRTGKPFVSKEKQKKAPKPQPEIKKENSPLGALLFQK